MAKCLFGFPIYNDTSPLVTPVYQGGAWVAGLPLSNLSNRYLHKVARSSSAAVADTVFQSVFYNAVTTPTVGLIAIPKHTISLVGTIRVRLTNGNIGTNSYQRFLDFSAGWSSVGTPTRVAANVTGSDGVPLDLIGDDSGAALEGYTRVLGNLGTTGEVKVVELVVAAGGTSTSLVIRVRDTTAGADRLLAVIDPTAAPPTPTMTTGTHVSTTLRGGQYRIVMLTGNVTTANTNELEVWPASTSGLATATTGTANVGDLAVQDITTDRLNYDSGYVSPWPAGLNLNDLVGTNVPFIALPANVAANMLSCEIRDATNAAGYVELARLIVAGAYQPTFNLMSGSGQGLEDRSEVTDADGGAAILTERPVRRTVMGNLDEVTESEMFASFWKMQKQLGSHGQLFFMWDSADTTYKHDRAFLARFAALSPITMAAWPRYQAPFSLVEEI